MKTPFIDLGISTKEEFRKLLLLSVRINGDGYYECIHCGCTALIYRKVCHFDTCGLWIPYKRIYGVKPDDLETTNRAESPAEL